MDTQIIDRKKHIKQDPEKALKEIMDSALILSIASEYACEDPFLKKIGANIQENIEVIEKHIEDLKREFVGKPVAEMDLSKPLKGVIDFAEHLHKAGDGTRKKCVGGELGTELDEKFRSLVSAIDGLKERVEGRSVSYTKTDSALGFFAHFKFIIRLLAFLSKYALRISALFVVVCCMIFLYLFITMETEKGPLEMVDQSKALILSKQADLAQISKDLKPLQEKIEGIRKDELSRKEEIQLLDLRMKAHQLADEQQKTLIEVEIEKKALEERLKKLEEVRRKSFLERLLRL